MKGGVSFFRVESRNEFRRVGGSILGESAFINIVELLSGKDFKSIDSVFGNLHP
jgi:pantothenate kinase